MDLDSDRVRSIVPRLNYLNLDVDRVTRIWLQSLHLGTLVDERAVTVIPFALTDGTQKCSPEWLSRWLLINASLVSLSNLRHSALLI